MDTTVAAAAWDPSVGFLPSPDTDDFAVDWSSSSPEISPVAYSPTFADYFGVLDAANCFGAAPLVQPMEQDDACWAAGSKAIKHSASDDEGDYDLYAIPSPPPAKKRQSSKSPSPRGAAQGKPSAKASSKPMHSLRTTARASRKAAAATSPSSSPSESSSYIPDESPRAAATEHHRARHNHNLIEKQYRNRLNSQFEQLLAALPEEGCVLGEEKTAAAARLGPDDRRISKANVLDKARRHIVALEAETKKLRAERKNLIENVQLMQQTILAQGGQGYGM